MKDLYWVNTKKATYGVYVENGIVTGGAPISKRFWGRPLSHLETFFRQRHIQYELIKTEAK